MYNIIIMLIIILIILLIIIRRRSKKNGSKGLSEMEAIEKEIMLELKKPGPNYERVKVLRSRMERLESEGTYGQSRAFKKRQEDDGSKGLQATLYVGSLLILAGAGGLVQSGLGEAGLVLLIMTAIGFYVGGILLRNTRGFKSVSQAFVGTGMATLPFIGLLLYNVTKIDPKIIWLMLSAIGVPVYFYAIYIMNNRIFAYFAILGLASMGCSVVSLIGLSIVWYFVAVMAVGIILNLVDFSKISPKLAIANDTMRISGQILPILTLIASLSMLHMIKEGEYLVLLGITILQLGLNIWINGGIIWETLLRLVCFAWEVLFIHVFIPNSQAIGIGMIIGAVGELCCSFIPTLFSKTRGTEYWIIEYGWIALSLVVLPVAGMFLCDWHFEGYWIYASIMLLVDVAIVIVSRIVFKERGWYYALLPIGVLLPIMLANTIGLEGLGGSVFKIVLYMIFMVAFEVLNWKVLYNAGDIAIITGTFVFAITSIITYFSSSAIAIVTLLSAVALMIWGIQKKSQIVSELSIYTFAIAASTALMATSISNYHAVANVLVAHLLGGSLLITSKLWDDERRKRLIVGVLLLLIYVCAFTVLNQMWVMVLFMLESAIVLAVGFAIKNQPLWIIGAVALCFSVIWFTKDLPFVWPVVLGMGLIGVVIGVIVHNNKKRIK